VCVCYLIVDLDAPDGPLGDIVRQEVPLTLTPPLIYVMAPNGRIYGVTVLGNEMFILRSTGSSIIAEAYNTHDFTCNERLDILNITSMNAIASCFYNNCLYISDTKSECIHRYDCSNKGSYSWPVGGICNGLSVTSEHNVLVTLSMLRQIVEYKTNGELINIIQLDATVNPTRPYIDYPVHSIQLSNRNLFVITNGRKDDEKAGLNIVDRNEHIVMIRDKPVLFIGGKWQNPVCIAVDGQDNVLLVDGCSDIKNIVKVYSSELRHLGNIVIPGHNFKGPYSMHLDEENKRLYIGENSGERMFVLEYPTPFTDCTDTLCCPKSQFLSLMDDSY